MNRFVFADANKCIGCRTCEIACAVAHQDESSGTLSGTEDFAPRLQLVKNAEVSVPVMCRQCDDAPCAQVCPNHAIVHEDGYVKVIQSRCIGCKTCVIACPYGAMSVMTRMKNTVSEHAALFQKQVPQSQALKCDLCSHREEGPACVQVCPTEAIRLIAPESLQQTSQQKREAAASQASVISA
ncbi:4Fe-4S dicluster domain-containing protein [Vibrio rhizosphaerae]|uniref:4Fe-4S dicluster domain-containing protein n=1 Tax=Vibrio rhizosphaerae TaxID=398736 RepID=A0ABU4INR8_9VIBR|nr:4Fe-4S dicluster domain-containing protein [Vibrio rhizosphaerae]MDW6091051.1 4Fe-4S dicluster domain-containing protein [Vibrio rhizosphaerae]